MGASSPPRGLHILCANTEPTSVMFIFRLPAVQPHGPATLRTEKLFARFFNSLLTILTDVWKNTVVSNTDQM